MEVIVDTIKTFFVSISGYMPHLLSAILVLVLGWVLAKAISKILKQILITTDLDRKIAKWFQIDQFVEETSETKRGIALTFEYAVFYLLMLVVLVIFFDILQLPAITDTLQSILKQISLALPHMLKAILIVVAFWIFALVAKLLVVRILKTYQIGDKIDKIIHEGEEVKRKADVADAFGRLVFYIILLLSIPAVLEALQISSLMEPLKVMLDKLMGFVPNLLAAIVVFFLGYLLARLIEKVVTNFADAAGADNLISKLKVGEALQNVSLSKVLGTLTFIAILIPVIGASFEILNIAIISQPITSMMNEVVGYIPLVVAAIVVSLFGFFLGKYLGDLTSTILHNIGFDNVLGGIGLSGIENRLNGKFLPSVITGHFILAWSSLFFAMEAFSILKLSKISDLIYELILFLPKILIAFVILGVGFYLARIVEELVKGAFDRKSIEGNLVSIVLKYSIIVFAFFMAFDQMDVAKDIVVSAFILVLGTIGLAIALSFGLGSKEIAGDYVKKLFKKNEEK